jgi:hypothetical protein
MSTGHIHHHGAGGHGFLVVNRLLKNPKVLKEFHSFWEINRDYDLPYLGGTSTKFRRVYFDRHLPEILRYEHDGHKKEFNPTPFLMTHETFERAVMDALGWHYSHAHQAATALEKRQVMEAGLIWGPYQHALEKYIKAAEHEKLKKVPPDLDMRPYNAPPVDESLIAHMEKAMGGKHVEKKSKAEASYSNEGHPSSHCGPVRAWESGDCRHFESPSSCELVRGHISPRGWCRYWESYKDEDKD